MKSHPFMPPRHIEPSGVPSEGREPKSIGTETAAQGGVRFEPVGSKAVDTSDDKAEEKADRDFHACFVQRAPKVAFYPQLVEEAQQVVDRIAGK
jgi:hypothetical protein